MDLEALKDWLWQAIDEQITPNPCEIAPRWQGGQIILQPANDSQPKEIPIEIFFKKVTGLRESLRVLEQKINQNTQLSLDDRSNLQSYITKCYGSLTTFNILFKEDKDKFVGAGKAPKNASKISYGDAQRKLGLNEYE